jgi:ribosomal protein S12 methylthiotransferase accessory factor YcaO
VRIAEASGGNPLFALELARGLGDGPAAALALPDSLQEAVSNRLDLIAPAVRDALRIVAALASPHVDQVARALDDTDAVASTVHLAHGH